MTMDRDYHRNYAQEYYQRKIKKFRKQLGGKCVRCESKEDLHFDHIDPKTKLFSISCFQSYSKSKLVKELKKCQLLCGSCHRKKTREGNDNKCVKLSDKQIKKIRSLYKSGEFSQRELASKYNVSQPYVSHICSNKVRQNS